MPVLSDKRGGKAKEEIYIAKVEPPAKGQRFLFDSHRDAPRGFGLRVTAAGGKAFILKYSFDGRQRRMTIGDWPTWSLEAARTEACRQRRDIDSKIDPLEKSRRRKAEPVMSEIVDLYTDSHVIGLVSEKAIRRYFERDMLPAIGRLKVCDVRRRDLIELVEAKALEAPTAARHLLAYIKGLFDWCVDREYIEASPAASIRPKNITPKGVKNALKPVQRLRVLDAEEIRAFWEADQSGIHRITMLALKLTLVTGQRPGEVAGMHAREISGDVWDIPADRRLKTSTANRVPLTPMAMDIIAQAQAELNRLSVRRKKDSSGYIFEARPGMPITVGALSKAVIRFTQDLQNKDAATWGYWRPHDLRRTCRTGLSACGFSSEIAERVIGHGGKGIEATYNQHQYDVEKRAALEAWERRLGTIIAGGNPDGSNVVPLKGMQA